MNVIMEQAQQEIDGLKKALKSANMVILALQEQRNEAHDMRAKLKADAMEMQEELNQQIKAKDARIAELEAETSKPAPQTKKNGRDLELRANA